MSKVVLIPCVSKKLSRPARARDLYVSSLFKFSLKYAESLNPSKIFILSAKYGLVRLEQRIQPYNSTLKSMPIGEVQDWAKQVLGQLKKVVDLEKDQIVFLCGERYRKYLIPYIVHHQVPLKGLGIGRQLHFLKTLTPNE